MTIYEPTTAPNTGISGGLLGDYIERHMAEAHALRAATIAWALQTFARWLWHAWTAGIREPRAARSLPLAKPATGRCN